MDPQHEDACREAARASGRRDVAERGCVHNGAVHVHGRSRRAGESVGLSELEGHCEGVESERHWRFAGRVESEGISCSRQWRNSERTYF